MIRALLAAALLLVACDPPQPRPLVAKPLPTVAPAPSSDPAPTPADGIPDRAALAASIPAEVAVLEERYRAVQTSLLEVTEALEALRARSGEEGADPAVLAREGAELQARARRLGQEAAELRERAAAVRTASLKLKAVAGPE